MTNKTTQILLVEDDQDIQRVVFQLLKMEGYNVSCAENGREALELLKLPYTDYDLILLDLMMPVMDGFEFYEKLSQMKLKNQPEVVIMSAGASLEHKKYLLGAKTSLRKPINIEDLLDAVRASLGPAETSL